jgi:hypothetical protein
MNDDLCDRGLTSLAHFHHVSLYLSYLLLFRARLVGTVYNDATFLMVFSHKPYQTA